MFTFTSGLGQFNYAVLYGSVQYYGGSNPMMQTFTTVAQDGGGTISGLGEWVGLTDATASTMAASSTPTGNYAMFRYWNGTDTNFKCVTSSGTSRTVVDSGVTANNGNFRFEVNIISGSKVVFKINGTEVCNSSGSGSGITTNLPSTSSQLNLMDLVSHVSATDTHRMYLSIPWVYVESDY